ncbi:MAG: hypothetical protein GY948_00740 [Alphaproteobacteria bacterium]|nr:hypothetical protein [Alphaproteobacteria bacterium]
MEEFIRSLDWVDVVGSTGALIVVAAYFATQMRYLNSDELLFPVVNLGGSLLIAFSLIFNFNLASALMEVFWIAISILGIVQGLRQRQANRA